MVGLSPRGLNFTWWECYSLCLWHEPTELALSFFLFCSCVCFCPYGPFNCISFHKFPRQLSVFSLCSSGLISALLVLSTIYLFMKVSFSPSPDVILCGWLGLKHQLTNSLGGEVAVYVWHKSTELAHSFFLFCSCVCFCLYGPFNCISFHKLSQRFSAFSLCSSGLISTLLVLSTIHLCIIALM